MLGAGPFVRNRTGEHGPHGPRTACGLDVKNCWTLAENHRRCTPDRLQYLLSRNIWDHDGLRDDILELVADHLSDPGGVLVVDETGDLKKSGHTLACSASTPATPGASRTQVSVRLTYATPEGHALIDQGCTCRSRGQTTHRGVGSRACWRIGLPTQPALTE